MSDVVVVLSVYAPKVKREMKNQETLKHFGNRCFVFVGVTMWIVMDS